MKHTVKLVSLFGPAFLCVCHHFGELYVYIVILATYALFMFAILTTNEVIQ